MIGMSVLVTSPRMARAEGTEDGELQPLPPPGSPPAPPPATAAGATADTVHLRGGALLRGTVYEVLPGDHVTILHPSGLVRAIPWADVDRVELGYRPGGTTPTPVATPSAAPAARQGKTGPMVRVHIVSKKAVQLYRQSAGEWHEACTSPCDEDMPLGDEYRISGSGIHQSRDFQLEGAPGSRVVLTINPGSRTAFVAGGVVMAVGGLVDYFSLVAFAAAAGESGSSCYYGSSSSSSYSSYHCGSRNHGGGATAVGVGMLIVGTAMMATGAIVMLSNNSTGVGQDDASSASAKTLDAYRREAIWRTPSAAEHIGGLPAVSLPILNHAF